MTIFVWHMTAKLAAVFTLERLGLDLVERPTTMWWAQRPLWVLVPGVFLVALTAVFSRLERVQSFW